MYNTDSNVDGEDQKVCTIMKNEKTIILLAKSDCHHHFLPDNEYSIEIERKFGQSIQTYFISPIQFDFINIVELGELLTRSDQWSGIILTSKRCIDALIMSIKMIPDSVMNSLKKLTFFTVGTSTRSYLLEKLQINSKGYHTGNSEDLAQFIVEQYETFDKSKSLLYPCSQIRTDPLMKTLSKHNISVREIHCYITMANQNLDNDFQNFKTFISTTFTMMMDRILLPVVFFSPSGVDNLYDYLQKYLHNDDDEFSKKIHLRYIAFGRQTAQRIESKNLNVWFTVSVPTAKSLAEDLYRKIMTTTNN